MTYDNWKTDTPDSYDYEEERECRFCGFEIEDGKEYCSRECEIADNQEGV